MTVATAPGQPEQKQDNQGFIFQLDALNNISANFAQSSEHLQKLGISGDMRNNAIGALQAIANLFKPLLDEIKRMGGLEGLLEYASAPKPYDPNDPTDPRNVYTVETHDLDYGKSVAMKPEYFKGPVEARTAQNDVFSFDGGEQVELQPGDIDRAKMYYRDDDAIGFIVDTKDGNQYLVGPDAINATAMPPEVRADLKQMPQPGPALQPAGPAIQLNPYASVTPQSPGIGAPS